MGKQLKIEVGKLYRTRNDRKVRIYATDIEGELPIHGAVYYPERNFWDVIAWRENGIDSLGQSDFDDFDIVSECEEESVNHPSHYGGSDNPYEAIKVIEVWQLNFNLGNVIKYISRAGKKGSKTEDLQKALWYLQREVNKQEKE